MVKTQPKYSQNYHGKVEVLKNDKLYITRKNGIKCVMYNFRQKTGHKVLVRDYPV